MFYHFNIYWCHKISEISCSINTKGNVCSDNRRQKQQTKPAKVNDYVKNLSHDLKKKFVNNNFRRRTVENNKYFFSFNWYKYEKCSTIVVNMFVGYIWQYIETINKNYNNDGPSFVAICWINMVTQLFYVTMPFTTTNSYIAPLYNLHKLIVVVACCWRHENLVTITFYQDYTGSPTKSVI